MAYVLCPGYVTSKEDGDRHYIGPGELARLHGLDLADCVVAPPGRALGWKLPKGAICLHPRQDGDYPLPPKPGAVKQDICSWVEVLVRWMKSNGQSNITPSYWADFSRDDPAAKEIEAFVSSQTGEQPNDDNR